MRANPLDVDRAGRGLWSVRDILGVEVIVVHWSRRDVLSCGAYEHWHVDVADHVDRPRNWDCNRDRDRNLHLDLLSDNPGHLVRYIH